MNESERQLRAAFVREKLDANPALYAQGLLLEALFPDTRDAALTTLREYAFPIVSALVQLHRARLVGVASKPSSREQRIEEAARDLCDRANELRERAAGSVEQGYLNRVLEATMKVRAAIAEPKESR